MTDEEIRIEHIKVKDLVSFAEDVIGAAEAGAPQSVFTSPACRLPTPKPKR